MSFIDPIRALITLAFVSLSRSAWIIPLAAFLSSAVTLLISYAIAQMPPLPVIAMGGFIGALLQASLFFWIATKWRKRRAARRVETPQETSS